MKKVVLSVVALAALTAPALAADLVTKGPPAAVVAPAAPLWDVAFGGVIMSDYNFRGISQSNSEPSVGAYFEPQLNHRLRHVLCRPGGLCRRLAERTEFRLHRSVG